MTITHHVTDDLEAMLSVFPLELAEAVRRSDNFDDLIEVILDLGRQPTARFVNNEIVLLDRLVTQDDIEHVTTRIGDFDADNRAGMERTLHRISAIRNRRGRIVGLTCRVGRAVYGTIDIINDLITSGESILILGKPGVGKTTMLREAARILAETRRVVIVDTSNEIAGDGDIPHPGIGMARRMQVPHDSEQHSIMIEAVENHMPQVIVVDEIGTEQEAYAARTIAERGVTLVATAHGNTLENLMQNPTLSDLIGGISSVTLSDEEARRRGTQKSILERKAPPCFDVLIEIQDKDTFAIHGDVAATVDLLLRGQPVKPEVRLRKGAGKVEVVQTSNREFLEYSTQDDDGEVDRYADGRLAPAPPGHEPVDGVRIFPYSVSRNRLERAIRSLGVSAQVVRSWEFADMVITLKEQVKKRNFKFDELRRRNIPVHLVRANTVTQLQAFLKQYFRLQHLSPEEFAQREAKEAIKQVHATGQPVDLSPQTAPVRRLQHEWAEAEQLKSSSFGVEPERFVRIYA